MNILALDLGTTTGWAFHRSGRIIISGSQSFKPSRFEGGGMRYVRFHSWLDEFHRGSPFGAVYFEEVRRHLGVDAAHAYGGFLGHLTAWCESQQIPYSGVPVGTIKKFITGKGNASKALVLAAIGKRGHTPIDDNEADALSILYWALHTHGGQS